MDTFGVRARNLESVVQNKSVNCVRIPHTIVFDRNKVTDWYFFSKQEKELKKKKRYTNEEVLRIFSKGKKAEAVVATFLHKEPHTSEKLTITIQYMTISELGNL